MAVVFNKLRIKRKSSSPTAFVTSSNFEDNYNALHKIYVDYFNEYLKYKGDNPFLPDTIVYQKYDNVIIDAIKKHISVIEIDMNEAIIHTLKILAPIIYDKWIEYSKGRKFTDKADKYSSLMIFLRDEIFKGNRDEYSDFIHKLNIAQKMFTILYAYSKYPIFEILELKKDSILFISDASYLRKKNRFQRLYSDEQLYTTLKDRYGLTDKNFKMNEYVRYIRYDQTTFLQPRVDLESLIIKGKHKYLGTVFRLFIASVLTLNDIVKELNKLELIFRNEYNYLELYKNEIFEILGDIDEDKLYDIETDSYISWNKFINKPRAYFTSYPIGLLYSKFVTPFIALQKIRTAGGV
jgi:hypothetical protein